MNLLREYIRELLKERGELGKQVFAQSAPEDSRHFGDEPDTQIEADLQKALRRHLEDGGLSSADLDKFKSSILQFMDDPDYNDVFIRYADGEVCRGTGMLITKARKLVPNFDNIPLEELTPRTDARQKYEAWTQKIPITPFEWTPRSDNKVSSWSTNDDRVCTRFAKKNSDLWASEQRFQQVGIILYADAAQNDFLDFSELYKFQGFHHHSYENEVAAIGPITVTSVKIYKEVTKEEYEGHSS